MDYIKRNQLFLKFQTFIQDFKQQPKPLLISSNSSLLNGHHYFPASIFWLSLSILLNLLALFYIFKIAPNQSQASSIMAQSFLLLTLYSRCPSLNSLLFKSTTYVKHYLTHQIIYQIGQFHRYMALSTIAYLATHIYFKPFSAPYTDEFLIILLPGLITLIAITGIEPFRNKYHNIFENIHRYVSYLALFILISYFAFNSIQKDLDAHQYLQLKETYLLMMILILTIYPWIGVKKITPIIQHISKHILILKMQGKPQYGTFSRVTLANQQFHSFSDSMFDFDSNDSFSLLICNSGDRTREIINAANDNINLVKNCTLRRHRSYGFMHHVASYHYVLIVVTGGGIAPVLPHLALNKNTHIIVLWLGHEQIQQLSPDFFLSLNKHMAHENISMHILNKSTTGINALTQHHIHQLILSAYRHYQPEALFIVSNKSLTRRILTLCHQQNIKAYGATFDS